ncbi:MAG TPA: hypothetical protein PLC24_09985, partial [Myxococcota bacterium]|nr:hypothetical protein [Myxococcota bacterium]
MSDKHLLGLALAVCTALTVACGGGNERPDIGSPDVTNDVPGDVIRPDQGGTDSNIRDTGNEVGTDVPDADEEVAGDVVADTKDVQTGCKIDDDCPDDPDNLCQIGKCLDGGTCGFGPRSCNDGFDCTADGCSTENGGCYHIYLRATPCTECVNDSDCGSEDPCDQNACRDVPNPQTSPEYYDEFPVPDSGKVCFRKPCAGCDDKNPCTNDSCTPQGVVINQERSCSDYNQCTTDSCSVNSGECVHEPVTPCVVCTAGDHAACNTAATNPDPKCLIGYCKPVLFDGGTHECSATQSCPNGAECDLEAGKCMAYVCDYQANTCDDANACTADFCDSSLGCQHRCICGSCENVTQLPEESVECDDGSRCTLDSCIEAAGTGCTGKTRVCQYEELDCDDGLENTVDSCDPLSGCLHTTIITCTTDEECAADNNKCTIREYCNGVTGLCVSSPLACDDGDPCTFDECSPSTGCVFTTIPGCYTDCTGSEGVCNDSNACTIDSCEVNPADTLFKICRNRTINCDDADPCTKDWCDVRLGCQHLETQCACDSNDDCVSDKGCLQGRCNTNTGLCEEFETSCSDGDSCTLDRCDHGTGQCLHLPDPNAPLDRCIECEPSDPNSDALCNANSTDPCKTGFCNDQTGYCNFQAIDCSDGDSCTTDTCDAVKGCLHTKITDCKHCPNGQDWECTTSNKCLRGKCDKLADPKGLCIWEPVACDDGNPCHSGECNPATGGCIWTDLPVDDGNACTIDSCNENTGMSHVEKICSDGLRCTADTCDPVTGNCVFTPKNCDDQNPCTTDYCS